MRGLNTRWAMAVAGVRARTSQATSTTTAAVAERDAASVAAAAARAAAAKTATDDAALRVVNAQIATQLSASAPSFPSPSGTLPEIGDTEMDLDMQMNGGGLGFGGHGGSGGLAMDLKSFYREFCEPPPSLKSSCCAVILSTLRLQLTAGMWCANALGKPPFGSGSAKIPKQILAFANPNVPQPHSPTAQPAAKPSASCLLCVPCACVVSAR